MLLPVALRFAASCLDNATNTNLGPHQRRRRVSPPSSSPSALNAQSSYPAFPTIISLACGLNLLNYTWRAYIKGFSYSVYYRITLKQPARKVIGPLVLGVDRDDLSVIANDRDASPRRSVISQRIAAWQSRRPSIVGHPRRTPRTLRAIFRPQLSSSAILPLARLCALRSLASRQAQLGASSSMRRLRLAGVAYCSIQRVMTDAARPSYSCWSHSG